MGKPSKKEISDTLLYRDLQQEDITVITNRRGTAIDSVTAHLGVMLIYYPNREDLFNELGKVNGVCLIWPQGESEEDIADMVRRSCAAGIDTHIFAEVKYE